MNPIPYAPNIDGLMFAYSKDRGISDHFIVVGYTPGSVTHPDEVVAEFLHRISRRAGLYVCRIVCHKESLLCLHDDDTFSSL